jgi:hypothetical protein
MTHPIQSLLDALSETDRRSRSQYQLTLAKLISALKALPQDVVISYEDGYYPGEEMSYRGYYSDLAFEDSNTPKTVSELLNQCVEALDETYEGYKGGDFTMSGDTPLWRSDYSCASQLALMHIALIDDKPVIVTRQISD